MNQWKRLFEELEVLQKDDILNDLARFKMIFAEIKKEREGNK